MMFEQLRGSSSLLSGNDGTERYGGSHRSTERVEQPVVRQRRNRALRPVASFNVETTHSIRLSVIFYATGVLDLAIVIEGNGLYRAIAVRRGCVRGCLSVFLLKKTLSALEAGASCGRPSNSRDISGAGSESAKVP